MCLHCFCLLLIFLKSIYEVFTFELSQVGELVRCEIYDLFLCNCRSFYFIKIQVLYLAVLYLFRYMRKEKSDLCFVFYSFYPQGHFMAHEELTPVHRQGMSERAVEESLNTKLVRRNLCVIVKTNRSKSSFV